MGKEEFKDFVKKNPRLIKFVKTEEMTWQKFYEMYDLYGEDNNIWDNYLNKEEVITADNSSNFTDVMSWVKNVDLNSLQEGINNVQRVLGVIQDLGTGKEIEASNSYKPRPLYKHFED